MIANACILSKAGGLDDKLEDWRKVVDIDFNGAYYCQSINQSINTLLTCCSLTSGVMAMQALPPAEARVIRTPAKAHKTVNT
jgi:hypothetical protein